MNFFFLSNFEPKYPRICLRNPLLKSKILSKKKEEFPYEI